MRRRPESHGSGPGPERRWDLFLDVVADGGAPVAAQGAYNMAMDELLLRRVQNGGRPALRLYRWHPACLSLGRNQPVRGAFRREAAARLSVDVVRRPTGGLAVLHDREITYAAALPAGLLGSPRRTYQSLNGALAEGLRRLGAPVEVVGTGGAAPDPALPGGYLAGTALEARCFGSAAPGEIAAGGRKLVGSAQRREGRAILQHGSILLEGEQAPVLELFGGDPISFDHSRPTTLAEALGATPPAGAVTAALLDGFRHALGIALAPATLTSDERGRLPEIVARYRSAEWTWRR